MIDEDRSGQITYTEFEKAMSSSSTIALLDEVGLNITDARVFFDMLLRLSDDRKVNSDAFVNGCLHVRGKAAAFDMQILLFETRVLVKKMQTSLRLSNAVRDAELQNERMLKAIHDKRRLSSLAGPAALAAPSEAGQRLELLVRDVDAAEALQQSL